MYLYLPDTITGKPARETSAPMYCHFNVLQTEIEAGRETDHENKNQEKKAN